MSKASILMLCATLIFFQSCGKKFTGFGTTGKDELKVEAFDFEYFSSKTKIKFENSQDKFRFTANIRMKKDSLIWFSLSPGVGIEVARGLITKDSLIFIDRINKNVVRLNFETLSQQFGFKLDYPLLESMVIGNMPVERNGKDMVTRQNNFYAVDQSVGTLKINNIIGVKTRKLEQLTATETNSNNTLELQYGDFKHIDEYVLPHKALLVLNYIKDNKNNQTNINMEHNRAQIEKKPLRFPFNIPQRYERK